MLLPQTQVRGLDAASCSEHRWPPPVRQRALQARSPRHTWVGHRFTVNHGVKNCGRRRGIQGPASWTLCLRTRAVGNQLATCRLRLCTIIASTQVNTGMERSASLPGGLPGGGGTGRCSDGRVKLPGSRALGCPPLLAHLYSLFSVIFTVRGSPSRPRGHRRIHSATQYETAHGLTRSSGVRHTQSHENGPENGCLRGPAGEFKPGEARAGENREARGLCFMCKTNGPSFDRVHCSEGQSSRSVHIPHVVPSPHPTDVKTSNPNVQTPQCLLINPSSAFPSPDSAAPGTRKDALVYLRTALLPGLVYHQTSPQ